MNMKRILPSPCINNVCNKHDESEFGCSLYSKWSVDLCTGYINASEGMASVDNMSNVDAILTAIKELASMNRNLIMRIREMERKNG